MTDNEVHTITINDASIFAAAREICRGMATERGAGGEPLCDNHGITYNPDRQCCGGGVSDAQRIFAAAEAANQEQ